MTSHHGKARQNNEITLQSLRWPESTVSMVPNTEQDLGKQEISFINVVYTKCSNCFQDSLATFTEQNKFTLQPRAELLGLYLKVLEIHVYTNSPGNIYSYTPNHQGLIADWKPQIHPSICDWLNSTQTLFSAIKKWAFIPQIIHGKKKEQVPVGKPASMASNCLSLSGEANLHVLRLKCVASSAIEDGEVSGDWAGSFIPLADCHGAGKARHASRGEKESPVLASCPVS